MYGSPSKPAHKRVGSVGSTQTPSTQPAQEVMDDRIAIIGISSILPGGLNIYESWESIRNGLDHVSDLPADRLDVTAYFNPKKDVKDSIYTKRGGFIPDYELDPRE